MLNFKDQVVIITGSSEGIGFSTAYIFAKYGATVVINGRNSEKLKTAYEKIKLIKGSQVLAIQGDITKEDFRSKLIKDTINKYKKIDILINNVGGGTDIHRVEEISDKEWQQTFDFNLTSSFALCRNVLPYMLKSNYGRIVNVSSVAGRFRGRLSGPHYSAAKAGMLGLTRHLAWEYAKYGITVNAIAPGFVGTERALRKWKLHTDDDKKSMLEQIPMKRFATPEEIANSIIFLASTEASYITGITLDVNGGFFMT